MRTRRRAARTVTLSDVARRAGVSTTTASYILNGLSAQMRISERTERRVREAAEALRYSPNRSARSLRTASTRTIGVVSDFVASGSPAGHMLAGASAAARASGRLVLVGETEGDPEVERLLVEEMLARRVDGVVYVRRDTCEISVPAGLRDEDVVLLNCLDPTGTFPSVLPDEHGAGRTAADVLVAAGVEQRVHVVGGDVRPGALAVRWRLEGLRAGLGERGCRPLGAVPCELTAPAAYAAVHRWLMDGDRPSALVCLDDRVALGVYQALAVHGLDVPYDVPVLSFGGSDLASSLRPTLCSVAVPHARMGRLAVERLVDRAPATVDRVPMPWEPGGSMPVTRLTATAGAPEG